jgi:hypothetical protein
MYICDNCKKEYIPLRKGRNNRFCSRKCKDQYKNDRKPRLTSKSYFKANEIKTIPLSDIQKQIILGSLLGDGSINKNNVFLITQSDAQKEYLDWKKELLGNIIMAEPTMYQRKSGHIQWHIHSIRHPEIIDIRKEVYPNGIKRLSNWVSNITELGLAIWYMDDGSFNRNTNSLQATISTDYFTEEENGYLAELLESKFNITAKVQPVFDKRYEKFRYRLRINRHDVSPLFDIVREYGHESMLYKIK